ncbi:MAG: ribonuclease III [Chitinophagales bacterium]|nr:ribonuclease III [Chitinophagales bacterium]
MTSDENDNWELKDFFRQIGNLYPRHSEHLFKVALTHTSANSKPGENFEQLEFLGDAVLSLIVAEYLFKKYPKKKEGDLTKLRSYIVSRRQLNEVAENLQLRNYIIHQIDENQLSLSKDLSGNVIEALIGAFYLDGGLKHAESFVSLHILNETRVENLLENYENPKSKLFEWVQKRKKNIEFRSVNANIQSPKEFEVHVFIDGKKYGIGKGKTIKQAERVAAKNTLNIILTHAGQGHLIKNH